MYRCVFAVFVLSINAIYSAPSSPSLSSSSSSSSSSSPQEQRELTGLTTYDQKQTGKYNIHLNIKDVAIIALDSGSLDGGVGDFGDTDYYEDYDLSDFTVKPIYGVIGFDPTTSKPLVGPSSIHSTEGSETPFSSNSSTNTNSSANDALNSTALHSSTEDVVVKVTTSTTKLPITIGHTANKTQSVIILSENTTPNGSISILGSTNALSPTGIVITTPTPSPDELPPKVSLTDLVHLSSIHSPVKPSSPPSPNLPLHFSHNTQLSSQPSEIPVQIILEPIQSTRQINNRHRPSANYRLKNRVQATPSSGRRITPPRFENDELNESNVAVVGDPANGQDKLRRKPVANEHRRRCAVDRNGKCLSNSNSRRSGSATMNGLLSLLSFLTPREMEKLD